MLVSNEAASKMVSPECREWEGGERERDGKSWFVLGREASLKGTTQYS
jgi:hypothetical protein